MVVLRKGSKQNTEKLGRGPDLKGKVSRAHGTLNYLFECILGPMREAQVERRDTDFWRGESSQRHQNRTKKGNAKKKSLH